MVKFLLSLSIFFTSAAQAAEKAGMPQLDPTTWFPQVFWLLITFGFLYLIVEKIVFPRLSDSIEQRNDHVSDNIDEANSIKDQAEKKYQEYLSLISNSKREAQNLINANKQNLQNNFENKKKEIDKKLEEKMKQVSKEIEDFKKSAASKMGSISTEVAKELVKTVSKIDTNNASASSIVEEVSKKYLKGLN